MKSACREDSKTIIDQELTKIFKVKDKAQKGHAQNYLIADVALVPFQTLTTSTLFSFLFPLSWQVFS